MTNMSKEEKRMMLFDMQEHPGKYTDEQVERLLADEEVKEFFHELAMARMAYIDYPVLKVNVGIGQPAKLGDTKPRPKQNNKCVIIFLINLVMFRKGQ